MQGAQGGASHAVGLRERHEGAFPNPTRPQLHRGHPPLQRSQRRRERDEHVGKDLQLFGSFSGYFSFQIVLN